MAKRRQRRSSRSKSSGYPPVVWMLFGLAIGLSVAFAVYINSREPARVTKQSTPQPASMQSALDDNGETAPEPEPAPAPVRKDKRFTFYDILPNVEILTSDSTMQAPADSTPKAVEEPGVYVLQAGSSTAFGVLSAGACIVLSLVEYLEVGQYVVESEAPVLANRLRLGLGFGAVSRCHRARSAGWLAEASSFLAIGTGCLLLT